MSGTPPESVDVPVAGDSRARTQPRSHTGPVASATRRALGCMNSHVPGFFWKAGFQIRNTQNGSAVPYGRVGSASRRRAPGHLTGIGRARYRGVWPGPGDSASAQLESQVAFRVLAACCHQPATQLEAAEAGALPVHSHYHSAQHGALTSVRVREHSAERRLLHWAHPQ